MKKILYVVGAIIVLAIVGSVISNNSEGVSPVAGVSKATAAAATATDAAPAAPASWQKVIAFSGSANKKSDNFELTGAPARMKYAVKGGDFAAATIYIVEDGHSLEAEGGFPEVMTTEAASDTTRLDKAPGIYYLDVNSANSEWTVTIEEQR